MSTETTTTMNVYQSNEQPKVGDKVKLFNSKAKRATHVVTSVLGGRLGNKVGVRSIRGSESREFYYYCLCPVASVDRPVWRLVWSPEGKEIARVRATNIKLAKRKAPMPYRKFLGEIYAVRVSQ